MEEIGFVYNWKNLINGKRYLGSHKGHPDDGYTGSGKLFVRAVEKYGIENFERNIIYIGPNFKKIERGYLVLLDLDQDENYYNLSRSSFSPVLKGENNPMYGKTFIHSEETKLKISLTLKGKYTSENNPNYGKYLSDETKLKMSLAQTGEKNHFYGKTHSEETRAKMRKPKSNTENMKKPKSEERRRNIREAAKNRPKVTCPHCGKTGGISPMKRHHFDNCKE